ncbi:ABC transporter permease [Chitinophaga sp. YIM B06452]|uniref:ABC transporter permease n=1 Tax=Chitinophaga sp. YIM B06452 TaxID=3082158 RepID=UPI0031FE98D1
MIQLLKIEWLKVRAYRTFWILTGLFLLAVPLLTWAFESILNSTNEMVARFLNAFTFPKVWDTTAWIGSLATPVIGIMLIIFLTNENNFRTVRQNIIDGWSRNQYINAKFGVLISGSLFITLVIAVTALVFGLKNGGGDVTDGSIFIWYTFTQSLAYLSMAFFLGVFMKRAGIAIGIYIMYVYVGEFAIAGLLDFKVKYHLGGFLPLECTDRLVPGMFDRLRDLMRKGGPGPSKTEYTLIAWAYIALFTYFSWYKMKKVDL